MTANAFMAGSLEPMLCVVSINHTAQMHGRLRMAGHYGVSFLSQEQQHLAAHFAGSRLDGLVPDFKLHGRTPILKRALAAVDRGHRRHRGMRRSHAVHRQRQRSDSGRRRRAAAALFRRTLCADRHPCADRQSRASRVLVAALERCRDGIPVIEKALVRRPLRCGTSTTNHASRGARQKRSGEPWLRKSQRFERSFTRRAGSMRAVERSSSPRCLRATGAACCGTSPG